MNAVVVEVLDISVSVQEPDQFVNDSFEKQLFGCEQRESLAQVEPHLGAKNAFGSRASAVSFDCSEITDCLHEVEVLSVDVGFNVWYFQFFSFVEVRMNIIS
jgi:hypothetical protein